MKMVVRAFALMLLIATIGVWAGFGGTLGWTKTSIPKNQTDTVTGIDFVEYHNGFQPGAEFLALGVGVSVVIFAATLFVRLTPKNQIQ